MALMTISHLTKEYITKFGKVKALDDVSFDIAAGEFLVIMGPSGSGKSTLVNILSAVDRKATGNIVYDGHELLYKAKRSFIYKYKRHISSVIFQDFNLIPDADSIENIKFAATLARRKPSELSFDTSSLVVDLHIEKLEGVRVSEISVGEQQRVAIARALADDSSILFADEPTGNLDSANAMNIITILKKINVSHGKTIVMVTHSQDLSLYADRIIHLKDGKIESIENRHEEGVLPEKVEAPVIGKVGVPFLPGLILGMRNVRRDLKRISFVGLGIGLTLSLLTSLLYYINTYSVGALNYVTPPASYSNIEVIQQEDLHTHSGASITNATLQSLREIPHVSDVEGVYTVGGLLQSGSTSIPFYGFTGSAVAHQQYTDATSYGSYFSNDRANEVILTQDAVKELGYTGSLSSYPLGRSIVIDISSIQKSTKGVLLAKDTLIPVKVVGILNTQLKYQTILVPNEFPLMHNLVSTKSAYADAEVYVDNQANALGVSRQIQAAGYTTTIIGDQTSGIDSEDVIATYTTSVLGIIAIIGALFAISSALLIIFQEQVLEIALMNVFGAKLRDLFMVFMMRAVTIGGISGFCAALFAWVEIQGLNVLQNASLYEKFVWNIHIPILYEPADMLATAGIGLLLGIVVNIYPTIKSRTIDTLHALHRD